MVFARQGKKVSIRYTGTTGGMRVEMYALEGDGDPVSCFKAEGSWACMKGDSAAAPSDMAIFINAESLARFADRVASRGVEEMRVFETTVAGRKAVCYDLPPDLEAIISEIESEIGVIESSPTAAPGGGGDAGPGGSEPGSSAGATETGADGSGDAPSEPGDILSAIAADGGQVCFADGLLVKLIVLGDPSTTFEARQIGKASDSDFDPPAEPVEDSPPSPVPTLIQGA